MIPVYVLDTSAWFKRYVQESGSERVDEIFADAAAGKIELCLLPIVYYELEMRLQRVRNTLKNRSAENPPQLRIRLALLDQKIQDDIALCKLVAEYIPDAPNSLHLFRLDGRVQKFMRDYPIGANDAVILVCLEELVEQFRREVEQLKGDLRLLYFVAADKDLEKAADQVEGVKVVSLRLQS